MTHIWRPWRGGEPRPFLPAGLIALALLARIIRVCLRLLRLGHGSTLPGGLARRLAPGIWERLACLPCLSLLLVSGTNGKTTTAHILHHLLLKAGRPAFSNSSGANLESGLLTAILTHLPRRFPAAGEIIFVLEIDEAALSSLAKSLRPKGVVLTNFCRDQLDRYGELDTVTRRLAAALTEFGAELVPVLNADDPGVAGLAGERNCVFYGLEAELPSCDWVAPREHHSCGACRVDLVYRRTYLGHCGDWYCPACGWARPARLAAATSVVPDADRDGLEIGLRLGAEVTRVHLPLPGLHNVYNALAAASAAARLGLSLPEIAGGLATVRPCFGRGERQQAGARVLRLFLIKNPAGANTVLETIAAESVQCLWFLINDRTADGRDVSWLWDVDFEGFWARNGLPAQVTVSGRRALDLAVRLRYAGLPFERLAVAPKVGRGLRRVAASRTSADCYVLATYTSMLDLRDRLVRARRW